MRSCSYNTGDTKNPTPQHVDVGLFVSHMLSLQLRMQPQDLSARIWRHRLSGAPGLRMGKRVAGVAMAPRPAPVTCERGLVWDPLARLCT